MSHTPLTVTELTARIKQVIEQGFAQISVTGEVSRLTKPSSGHLYFTIKDSHAAISAVVWRTTAVRLNLRPEEGKAYVFSGHISLYEPRGTYQIVVQRVAAVGAGQLAEEFEHRKQLFASRGWFEPAHKKTIPRLPQHIGIVTSATAAAFEDVKKVFTSRPAWLQITLSPCVVQGEQAAQSVADAITRLHHLKCQPDVILLVRGGGSMEDLWCFNDEKISQAVFDSKIPIITGIGHEIDTTLVDWVADLRAATPSNAAELACPDRATLQQQLPSMRNLSNLLMRRLQQARQQLGHLGQRQRYAMQSSQDKHHWKIERLNHLINQQTAHLIRQRRNLLRSFSARLHSYEPNQRLRENTANLHAHQQSLLATAQLLIRPREKQRLFYHTPLLPLVQRKVQRNRQTWQGLHEHLLALNPKQVLKRGYAMTTDLHGIIMNSASALNTNQRIHLHYHDGHAEATVNQVIKG